MKRLVFFLAAAAAPLAAQQPGGPKKPDLPLVPGRTAEFTTGKGTWMSLDVSPDGQTIVFDLVGDLYTLPIGGGKATRLTHGQAYDAQPRYSPDGKRIVFVSDRSGGDNVWILSADGKDTVQVTKGNDNLYMSPEWTPDGQYVVASKSGGLGGPAKLWLYNVNGGTGVQLIKEPAQLKTVGAAFGPDGRYIWYSFRQGDWSYNAMFPQYQLAVYDRETGTKTTMSGRYGSAFRPALSPDGKWLAYGSRQETETGLVLREVATGNERWLAYPVQRDDQESRASLDVLPGYSFMPDSRSIVISYGGEIWRVPVEGSAAQKIPFSADVKLDIGPEVKFVNRVDTAATFNAHQIRDAVPSPDGSKLAFAALDRIYVMDYPSGTPMRLTNQEIGEQEPAWSPDGKSVAFVTWSDADGGQIMKAVVVPGGKSKPLALTAASASYRELAFSPDGSKIVAVRGATRDLQQVNNTATLGPSNAADFIWVPAGGGPVTMITPSGNRGNPHFGSDPNRIYAYSFADGLVSFRWDGTDIKSHLKVTGPMLPGAGVDGDTPLSPVGADLPQPGRVTPERRIDPDHLEQPTWLDRTDPGEQGPQAPPAGLILVSPKGDQALAQVGMDMYLVTIPIVGGATPTVSVAAPDAAIVPVKKLNEIGGQFPAWSADGRKIHWSVGNAHLVYDLDRAKVVEDSLKAAAKLKPDTTAAKPDSTKKETPGYKPVEVRIAVSATRDNPQGTAVLRGGRAITMKGKEIIENADIVVRNNRIVAVGARGSVQIPAGAKEIDVSGKTILPGFVDLHYHPQWLVPEIHSNQTWQYLITLAYGTTTTRDPQTATTDVLTYQDKVETGEMIGPRIYHTGPGVFISEQIKDLDHARRILKRYASYYDVKTLKMYMTGNRQQREWVIMAAKEVGIMPTTEGGLDYKLEMTHAMDGYPGIEHALPILPKYNDVTEVFKASQTTNSPTVIVSYGGPFGENYFYTNENLAADKKLAHFTPEPELSYKIRRRGLGNGPGPGGWFMKDEYVMGKHGAFVKELIENGARAGIGSHGQLQGLGFHWEMWGISMGGISNHDLLRVATIYGAEALGMDKDIGSLEAGKLADIVVLDANPLENIRNTNTVRYVMKNGRLYEGETLNEIYPRQRALPKQFWMGAGVVHTEAGIR
ncbi:MAG: amidohydrolase family protein [Gemmatimonadota bacterium]